MGEVAVEVKNLYKSFKLAHRRFDKLSEFLSNPFLYLRHKRLEVLKNINFKVYRGELFAIIGPNGAGKSTLLKILSKIYKPDKGQVIIHGKVAPFLELGVGFHPDLTVRENLFLNGLILGMKKSFLKSKMWNILRFAGLSDFVDIPLKNLSSGMQVRLAFSIAFLSEADIYILDEVLAVGDIEFQKKSLETISKLKQQGKTIILVTHNLEYVKENADRAILLHKGRAKGVGDSSQVVKKYLDISQ